jgi:arylsulfatase A-like enzyme
LDDPLSKFLDQMISEGHLDNTLVYLYSDHGDHINFIFNETPSFKSELFNPLLVVLLPDSQKEIMGKIIESNTQKLLTHRDIFASDMKYLGFGNQKQVKGTSLLQDQVPDRSCHDVGTWDCMCPVGK